MSVKNSLALGAPVNLYRFQYGEDESNVFCYTSHTRSVDYGGDAYEPLAIRHDDIVHEGRPKGAELRITVPRNSGIAAHMRGVVPRRVIRVLILETDIVDAGAGYIATYTPIHHGRISGTEPLNERVRITSIPAGAGMKMPGLTRTYSRQCNIPLYGEKCQASLAAATRSAVVDALDASNVVTLQTGWNGSTADTIYFVGGIFKWETPLGSEYRAIISVDDDTLLLDGPTHDLEVSDEVEVILGCPRTMDACRNLHNNINNFGGCPFIPTEDIWGKNTHT